MERDFMPDSQKREIKPLLALGIFFLPFIFAWFTLRKGHTSLSKIISFGWLLFMLVAGNNSGNNPLENKWYAGGTLHKVTVQEWKNATYENKLATTSDMVFASDKIKTKINNSGSFEDSLRFHAQSLMTCIDEASAGQGYENMKVSDIGVSCIILLGWN